MYGRNFKPKIFADITMPAKQSYGPNIGKIFVIFLNDPALFLAKQKDWRKIHFA